MYELIKVIAEIELFIGKNMLQTPIYNKYQPIFCFEDTRINISGRIDLINMESLAPGLSGIVQVTFIKGMISDEYFEEGVTFTISEGGGYDLGKGKIIELLN